LQAGCLAVKRFGFIEMLNNAEADQAIKGPNKSMMKGREIKLNEAEESRRKKTYRNKRY